MLDIHFIEFQLEMPDTMFLPAELIQSYWTSRYFELPLHVLPNIRLPASSVHVTLPSQICRTMSVDVGRMQFVSVALSSVHTSSDVRP